jgi:hypothetical protein
MKIKILLVMAFVLPYLFAFSQGKKKNFENCNRLSGFQVFRFDTVHISCDTAYILNSRTFRLYNTVYLNFKNNNKTYNDILKTYESLVVLQEENITHLNEDYTSIRHKFDSLAITSVQISNKTQNSLSILNDSLLSAITELTETKKLIHAARKDLSSVQRENFRKNVYWGGGGIFVGMLSASIIFMIANGK